MLPVFGIKSDFVTTKFHRILILIIDLLGVDHRETGELDSFEIGFVHIDSGNLVIIIASVIGDALIEIVTRTIDGDFELSRFELGLIGATGLVDGVENMEVLADGRELVIG